jgi:hypothetical protein
VIVSGSQFVEDIRRAGEDELSFTEAVEEVYIFTDPMYEF